LQIGGGLRISNTPLSKNYTEEEIKVMCLGIQGRIYM